MTYRVLSHLIWVFTDGFADVLGFSFFFIYLVREIGQIVENDTYSFCV